MYVIFTYITFHCVTVYFLIKYIITRASQFPGGLLLTIERQIKFLTVNFKIQRKWSRKSCNFIKQKKNTLCFTRLGNSSPVGTLKITVDDVTDAQGRSIFQSRQSAQMGYRPHLARLPELVIGCSKQNKNRSRQRHYYQLGLVKKTRYLFARCSKQLMTTAWLKGSGSDFAGRLFTCSYLPACNVEKNWKLLCMVKKAKQRLRLPRTWLKVSSWLELGRSYYSAENFTSRRQILQSKYVSEKIKSSELHNIWWDFFFLRLEIA